MSMVCDLFKSNGREFHTVGALTENARSPSVLNLAKFDSIKRAFVN